MQWEPWWDQHWIGAQNATSHVVRAAIRYVSHTYPYWNRTNGADHFLVYSYDRGMLIVAPIAPIASALLGKAITLALLFPSLCLIMYLSNMHHATCGMRNKVLGQRLCNPQVLTLRSPQGDATWARC